MRKDAPPGPRRARKAVGKRRARGAGAGFNPAPTGAGDGHGGPEESVDRRKALRVVAAATDWARRHGALDDEIRFDVVAVTGVGPGARLELFQGAFDATGGDAG